MTEGGKVGAEFNSATDRDSGKHQQESDATYDVSTRALHGG